MPLSSRDAHDHFSFFRLKSLPPSPNTPCHSARGEREQRKEKALVEQTLAEERVLKPTIVATRCSALTQNLTRCLALTQNLKDRPLHSSLCIFVSFCACILGGPAGLYWQSRESACSCASLHAVAHARGTGSSTAAATK